MSQRICQLTPGRSSFCGKGNLRSPVDPRRQSCSWEEKSNEFWVSLGQTCFGLMSEFYQEQWDQRKLKRLISWSLAGNQHVDSRALESHHRTVMQREGRRWKPFSSFLRGLAPESLGVPHGNWSSQQETASGAPGTTQRSPEPLSTVSLRNHFSSAGETWGALDLLYHVLRQLSHLLSFSFLD